MCRLGFVSSVKEEDYTQYAVIATSYYSSGNDDGFGVGYINSKGMQTLKVAAPAGKSWINMDMSLFDFKTNSLIFHDRKKTHGDVSEKNTHPFISEDKELMLMHNGVLDSWEKSRDELIRLGHIFTSQVDSEVLLHAYEEWKEDMFTKLNELECSGYVTFIILKKDGTILAYTDNTSLEMKETEGKIEAMSDNDLLIDSKAVEPQTLYTIKNGKILEKKEIGQLETYITYGYTPMHLNSNSANLSWYDNNDVDVECRLCGLSLGFCEGVNCIHEFKLNKKVYCCTKRNSDFKGDATIHYHFCKECIEPKSMQSNYLVNKTLARREKKQAGFASYGYSAQELLDREKWEGYSC